MVVLASASPRRADLLSAAGIPFESLPVDVDETPLPGESPEEHVRRLADLKAQTASGLRPGSLILAADTTVSVDGRILGKPRDGDDAAAMLRLLSGRAHEVLTGVAVVAGGPHAVAVRVARTAVWFAPLSDAEIDWYVQSGEPMDKAGAYAIQGLASRFVTRIDGSYSNVVGLPVTLVCEILRKFAAL